MFIETCYHAGFVCNWSTGSSSGLRFHVVCNMKVKVKMLLSYNPQTFDLLSNALTTWLLSHISTNPSYRPHNMSAFLAFLAPLAAVFPACGTEWWKL